MKKTPGTPTDFKLFIIYHIFLGGSSSQFDERDCVCAGLLRFSALQVLEEDGSPGCQTCLYIRTHRAGVKGWLSLHGPHVPEQNASGSLISVSLMSLRRRRVLNTLLKMFQNTEGVVFQNVKEDPEC